MQKENKIKNLSHVKIFGKDALMLCGGSPLIVCFVTRYDDSLSIRKSGLSTLTARDMCSFIKPPKSCDEYVCFGGLRNLSGIKIERKSKRNRGFKTIINNLISLKNSNYRAPYNSFIHTGAACAPCLKVLGYLEKLESEAKWTITT